MIPRLLGTILMSILLIGCAPNPEQVKQRHIPAIISVKKHIATTEAKPTIHNWNYAGLYWGVVVKADNAYYWVSKNNKVYCINGAAHNITPNCPPAPPSVTLAKAQAAIKGLPLPQPRTLEIATETFEKDIAFISSKKESLTSYKLSDLAYVHFNEFGNNIETIRVTASLNESSEAIVLKTIHQVLLSAIPDKKYVLPDEKKLLTQAKAHRNELSLIIDCDRVIKLKVSDTDVLTFEISPLPL